MTQQPQALKLLGVLFCGPVALIVMFAGFLTRCGCAATPGGNTPEMFLHLAKKAAALAVRGRYRLQNFRTAPARSQPE
jgi:hypothetical protein